MADSSSSGHWHKRCCCSFEWAEGYTKPFGMYAWRPDGSADRELKKGAESFIQYNKVLPDSYEAVKAVARRMGFNRMPTYADMAHSAAMVVKSQHSPDHNLAHQA